MFQTRPIRPDAPVRREATLPVYENSSKFRFVNRATELLYRVARAILLTLCVCIYIYRPTDFNGDMSEEDVTYREVARAKYTIVRILTGFHFGLRTVLPDGNETLSSFRRRGIKRVAVPKSSAVYITTTVAGGTLLQRGIAYTEFTIACTHAPCPLAACPYIISVKGATTDIIISLSVARGVLASDAIS